MELRYNEVERARGIYERYVRCLPEVKSWVRYAKFEMKSGNVARARTVYERAVQELEGEANMVRMTDCAMPALRLDDCACGLSAAGSPICWGPVQCCNSCCIAPAGGAVHEVCRL